jgi:hypothetical protein
MHGFASNFLNLCNPRNLWIFPSSGSGFKNAQERHTPIRRYAHTPIRLSWLTGFSDIVLVCSVIGALVLAQDRAQQIGRSISRL